MDPIRINDTISLYPPLPQSSAVASSSPKLIILSTWIGASDRQILRFVSGYQNIFPSAKIYVVKIKRKEYIWTSYDKIRPSLQPLIEPLKGANPQDVLLATYSNGGLLKTTLLAETYLSSTGQSLAPHRMVLDSCPDRETVERFVHAIQFSLPQPFLLYYPLLALTYGIMYARTAWMYISSGEGVLERSARVVNDGRLMREGFPRCYIFSKTDRTIGWKDVVQHANDAERKGWKVNLEEFVGSGHVDHMRVDGERYWKLIQELWYSDFNKHTPSKL